LRVFASYASEIVGKACLKRGTVRATKAEGIRNTRMTETTSPTSTIASLFWNPLEKVSAALIRHITLMGKYIVRKISMKNFLLKESR